MSSPDVQPPGSPGRALPTTTTRGTSAATWQTSSSPLRAAATFYVEVFRNTPLTVVFFFLGLPALVFGPSKAWELYWQHKEIRAKLRSEKVAFDEYMPIGTMIEVPRAALEAPQQREGERAAQRAHPGAAAAPAARCNSSAAVPSDSMSPSTSTRW